MPGPPSPGGCAMVQLKPAGGWSVWGVLTDFGDLWLSEWMCGPPSRGADKKGQRLKIAPGQKKGLKTPNKQPQRTQVGGLWTTAHPPPPASLSESMPWTRRTRPGTCPPLKLPTTSSAPSLTTPLAMAGPGVGIPWMMLTVGLWGPGEGYLWCSGRKALCIFLHFPALSRFLFLWHFPHSGTAFFFIDSASKSFRAFVKSAQRAEWHPSPPCTHPASRRLRTLCRSFSLPTGGVYGIKARAVPGCATDVFQGLGGTRQAVFIEHMMCCLALAHGFWSSTCKCYLLKFSFCTSMLELSNYLQNRPIGFSFSGICTPPPHVAGGVSGGAQQTGRYQCRSEVLGYHSTWSEVP